MIHMILIQKIPVQWIWKEVTFTYVDHSESNASDLFLWKLQHNAIW